MAERTIAQSALTFQYEGENEKLRSLGLYGTLRNYSPLMVKFTISSIIDATSSQERLSESSGNKLRQSGKLRQLQLALKKATK